MSRLKTQIIILVLAVLAAVGCQRKELLDPHDHNNLVIKANFDSLALAQLLSHKSDYSNPGEPKTTSYILYEKTTGKIAYRGYFKGLQSGMYVDEGLYDLLLYTTDFNELDANFFIGMDRPETAETHTRQVPLESAPVKEAAEEAVAEDGEPVNKVTPSDVTEVWMVDPDPTFGVLVEDVAVFKDQENKLVEAEFVQKSFKYYLTIECLGLQSIHTAKMNLSGLYTTAFLANEEHRMSEVGSQTVDLQIFRTKPTSDEELGKGQLYGEFWSFGPNQRDDIIHSITLYFKNGSELTIALDEEYTSQSQIKSLTRGGEIIFKKVLEIKGPQGGFQPGVGDWDDPTDVEIEF